jgi:hypothetical protein
MSFGSGDLVICESHASPRADRGGGTSSKSPTYRPRFSGPRSHGRDRLRVRGRMSITPRRGGCGADRECRVSSERGKTHVRRFATLNRAKRNVALWARVRAKNAVADGLDDVGDRRTDERGNADVSARFTLSGAPLGGARLPPRYRRSAGV